MLGHENSPDSEYAIDNNPKTNWHSNTQHPDIVFDIELDSIYHVSGLRLDPGQRLSNAFLDDMPFQLDDPQKVQPDVLHIIQKALHASAIIDRL